MQLLFLVMHFIGPPSYGHIIFNAIFIFGLCGAPAMGVKGAAFATLLARVFELAGCLLFSAGKGFIRLRVKKIFTFEKELILDFWRYTSPLVGSYMLWGTGFTAYTAIMGHMGKDAAAANAIAAVVRDLCCCVCNGVAFGSSVIIGNEMITGYVQEANGLRTKIRLLDFFGRLAEEETVTLREIEILEIDTQEEKMYGILEDMERQRMQLLPNQESNPEEPIHTEETDN
jgi:hypothetical protein